jgi:hypothetical protein
MLIRSRDVSFIPGLLGLPAAIDADRAEGADIH